jgi:hypothetical protein
MTRLFRYLIAASPAALVVTIAPQNSCEIGPPSGLDMQFLGQCDHSGGVGFFALLTRFSVVFGVQKASHLPRSASLDGKFAFRILSSRSLPFSTRIGLSGVRICSTAIQR